MSDNKDILLINKLNDLLKNLTPYEGVTWTDGAEPPLSATNLNKSEDALKQLLWNFNESGEGAIQQIVDVLYATFEKATSTTERTSNLETTVKTNTSDIKSIDGRVETNESNIKDLKESVTSNSNNISNNNEKIDSLDTDVKLLQTNVANNTTNITSLQQDLDNIQENVEGLIGDKVVQDGDEVILRCGTSTTVLFDVSE